jgi:hypothetical protein
MPVQRAGPRHGCFNHRLISTTNLCVTLYKVRLGLWCAVAASSLAMLQVAWQGGAGVVCCFKANCLVLQDSAANAVG